ADAVRISQRQRYRRFGCSVHLGTPTTAMQSSIAEAQVSAAIKNTFAESNTPIDLQSLFVYRTTDRFTIAVKLI
ncbi:hypothetical protein, partial [Klebsiella pneumoniae]|uniref:hypothetical protein n=1 Tax=Klebsiella pneumoniae TaxID=573 RepID=UPI0013D60A93